MLVFSFQNTKNSMGFQFYNSNPALDLDIPFSVKFSSKKNISLFWNCSFVIDLDESDTKLYSMALTSMTDLIRASTTSMTSVPKPLKFMIPHYDKMKEVYAKITDESVKVTNYLKQKNAWIHCWKVLNSLCSRSCIVPFNFNIISLLIIAAILMLTWLSLKQIN